MKMGRDVFGNGRRIDETLERFVFEKTVLNTYRGARSAQVRFAVGITFQTVKQELRLEDARVRTFKRLENIFALCVMAYVFMTKYQRGSKRFKKIIKLLGDNVETLAFKIHSLLSAIRELYLEAKVRFITGRPRKAEKSDSAQMFFVLE